MYTGIDKLLVQSPSPFLIRAKRRMGARINEQLSGLKAATGMYTWTFAEQILSYK